MSFGTLDILQADVIHVAGTNNGEIGHPRGDFYTFVMPADMTKDHIKKYIYKDLEGGVIKDNFFHAKEVEVNSMQYQSNI